MISKLVTASSTQQCWRQPDQLEFAAAKDTKELRVKVIVGRTPDTSLWAVKWVV